MNQEEELRGCRKCQTILSNPDELPFLEDRYLVLHVKASVINTPTSNQVNQTSRGGGKKNKEKDKKEEEKQRKKERSSFCLKLKCLVSALRNCGGGVVLVHIVGLEKRDRCLHHFHELVDPRLNEMIENGSLFVNIYRKNWIKSILEEEKKLQSELYSDIVALVGLPTKKVVTVNFNTKVPHDFSIVDPTCEEIINYLKKEKNFRETVPCLRGLDILQESRKVQHKTFDVKDEESERSILNDPVSFAEYIWNTLKLGHCISAFSKVEGGGSFYLGIAEDNETFQSYITKKLLVNGFHYDSQQLAALETALRQQIKRHTVVLFFGSGSTTAALPSEYVKIKFYEISSNKFVCEVAIAAVNGLVFHTKQGPVAYDLVDDNKLDLVDIKEWKERLLKEYIDDA